MCERGPEHPTRGAGTEAWCICGTQPQQRPKRQPLRGAEHASARAELTGRELEACLGEALPVNTGRYLDRLDGGATWIAWTQAGLLRIRHGWFTPRRAVAYLAARDGVHGDPEVLQGGRRACTRL